MHAAPTDTLHIDGSHGEGGGQILRTSATLAALTGRTIEIANIRARRRPAGLQPQHLAAVRAAAALCGAELTSAQVGSSHLRFAPRAPVAPGEYRFDIGTAGATGLVAQTVLVPLALAAAPSRVTIVGGTHIPHAPPADYLERVYAATLRRAAGVRASVAMRSAGFYPRGGGEVELAIEPAPPAPFTLAERGALRGVRGWVLTARLAEHVARRGAQALAERLEALGLGARAAIETIELPALGIGAAVGVAVEYAGGAGGFVAHGERGKPIEQVAAEAAGALEAWWMSGASCDEHLADQLVLPAVAARGTSRWTTSQVTEHLRTVLWLVKQFVVLEASLEQAPDGSGTVTLTSPGLGASP